MAKATRDLRSQRQRGCRRAPDQHTPTLRGDADNIHHGCKLFTFLAASLIKACLSTSLKACARDDEVSEVDLRTRLRSPQRYSY